MSTDFDPEATRIATVHPDTGVEILASPTCNDAPNDATVVGKLISPLDRNSHLSAEFVPHVNARATGEITCAWESEDRLDRRFKSIVKNTIQHIRTRKKSVLIIFLATLAVTSLFLTEGKADSAEKNQMSKNRIDSEVSASVDITPPTKSPRGRTPVEDATLKQAVDALINGNLEKAKSIYCVLSDRNPDDDALGTAVKILKKQKGSVK